MNDVAAIGFAWGAFFATVALLAVGGLAVFAQSHHRVALQSTVSAILTAAFVVSYLGWLPATTLVPPPRLTAHAGIVTATLLGLLLLLDLGLLRERHSRARILWSTAAATACVVAVSWLLTAAEALTLATFLALAVTLLSLAVSIRSALRGDEVAWLAALSLLFALLLLAGLNQIAMDRQHAGWQVHAASAFGGVSFLTCIGAMLWQRYSYLIEVRQVLAQGPRYDPITRLRTNAATAHMIADAFRRQKNSTRPILLVAVAVGNLQALEAAHGRAALNHALFVCGTRLRRSAPPEMDLGRLYDDGFLLVSRDARDLERLMKVGRRLARQLSYPVTLHTSDTGDEPEEEQTEWAAQVGVGLLATTGNSQPAPMMARVHAMARTAIDYESRVAWHDPGSDTVAELPDVDSTR